MIGSAGKGRFRLDLYYRLNVFPIRVAPLRERRQDIPLLAWLFADHFAHSMGKTIESIPDEAMELLQRQPWPGNVRELRNAVERAVIVSTGPVLTLNLPDGADGQEEHLALEEVERRHISRVLSRTNWRIAGEGGAARLLGVKRTTLQSKLEKLGISR